MNIFISPRWYPVYRKYPITFIDVGARGGIPDHWKRAERYLSVIGFEPDDRSYDALREAQYSHANKKYLKTILSGEKKNVQFYLTEHAGDSSMFKPNDSFINHFPYPERFAVTKTIELKSDTLDHQLSENQFSDADFIKIDTQGSELLILQGGSQILENAVFGLELEVEFQPMYQQQPLFSDVDSFVKKFGFQLFDLRPFYWKRSRYDKYGGPKGQIVYADALYLKDDQHTQFLLDRIDEDHQKKAKLLRIISICLIYGYQDYAISLIESVTCFNPEERKAIQEQFKRDIGIFYKFPNFPGSGRLARIFYYLWNILEPWHKGWITGGERRLGNL